MPKNGLNVSLNSYDDIFSTEETRQEEQREQVQQIPIDELLNKDKRPSVLARLHELVQAAAELPGKVRHKEQERGL